MARNRYTRRKKHPGDRAAICDTCGVRYLRSQLVRGPDDLLRCSGAGTLNDARGRTEFELNMLQAEAASQEVGSFDYCEGVDGRIDDTGRELPVGGGEVG